MADHANGEVRQVGEDIKPASRLHAPNLLLQRGEAIREGDEVRQEHNLKQHINLKTDTVQKIADLALVRPAGQGG
eukprot:1321585-Pleurochrysis_carterae.AAC.1